MLYQTDVAKVEKGWTSPHTGWTRSLGKPEREGEVRETFKRMGRVRNPSYIAESGTVIEYRNVRAKKHFTMTVHLDQRKMQEFSTPQGFEKYKEAFDNFYSSDIYMSNGLEPPKITDIAGGLSLGVLLSLGAVTAIDGTSREDPSFRQAVKRAMYQVLIGFDIRLLKKLRPDIEKVIDSDPWLERVTSHTMGEASLPATLPLAGRAGARG